MLEFCTLSLLRTLITSTTTTTVFTAVVQDNLRWPAYPPLAENFVAWKFCCLHAFAWQLARSD